MRVKSEFWVGAYVRRCQGQGVYATLRRRGSPEAGAIFIVLDTLDGRQTLFAAAPQSLVEDDSGDRVFTAVPGVERGDQVMERLAREMKFDPDIWVVDVEDRAGRHFLELVG
jgi:hypothetical protein